MTFMGIRESFVGRMRESLDECKCVRSKVYHNIRLMSRIDNKTWRFAVANHRQLDSILSVLDERIHGTTGFLSSG